MKSSTLEELQRVSDELQKLLWKVNILMSSDEDLSNNEEFGTMRINLCNERDTLLKILGDNKNGNTI